MRAFALVFTSLLVCSRTASAEDARPSAPVRGPDPTTAGAPSSDEWTLGAVRSVAIATQLGAHHRLDAPPAFAATERDALGGGVDLRAALARRFAVTLSWERFGLGGEQTGITDFGFATIHRRADAFVLGMRLEPWANEFLAASIAIGVGAAWQHASANGVLWPELQPGFGTPLACSGTSTPAPAMRVDLGLEAPISEGLSVFANGGLGVYAFGDGPMGGCVLGAGSTQMFAARLGFAYAFDVGGNGG
jgi:hypothetical protein